MNTLSIIDDFRRLEHPIQFISGKWFNGKNEEIKRIDQYLCATRKFKSMAEVDDFKEMYKVMYGTTGLWPQLKIVTEAEQFIKDYHKEHPLLPNMCYPLARKQLMIINILLKHDEEVFFILTGVGGSGKSTFANIICQIFENDTAALTLSDLGQDFKLATGIDKRLIYSTEINSDDINNGQLKQLFSNEEITVNPKFAKPYKARCQSSFFFNCNKVPYLDLSDTGLLRRIIYYGMNVPIQNPNRSLNKREWTHSDLVNIVAHALELDMTNWRDFFKDETRDYLVSNNSVYRFRDLSSYKEYEQSCRTQNLKPFSQPRWEEIRELLKEWGYFKPKLIPLSKEEEGQLPF